MGYKVSLVIGIILCLMAITGIIVRTLEIGPMAERAAGRAPYGPIFLGVIAVILITIGIIGLRKKKKSAQPPQWERDTTISIREDD